MDRREFLTGAAAIAGLAGCNTVGSGGRSGKIKFGACVPFKKAALLKSIGYDYFEYAAALALIPDKGEEEWKRKRDEIANLPLPIKACNGFLPGTFRLTGPNADFEPALKYAETVLRRAEEVGIEAIVFGSGGARNVPGDITAKNAKDRPDTERGFEQYIEFCKILASRVSDLKTVEVVMEPLRPNEANFLNYVWQGKIACQEINSPRVRMLADLFHMMMGRESAESIVQAGPLLRHCHVASYETRKYPGSDPSTVCRLKPYFDALKSIGYDRRVSCECGFASGADEAKSFETALTTLKGLA